MPLTRTPKSLGKIAPVLGIAVLGLAAHPAAAQTTLSGTFYHDATQNITSIATAQQFIASNAPTGTFSATESVLQNGYGSNNAGEDQASVTSFLGSDSTSYVGQNTNVSDGIFTFNGFLNVPTAGAYTFALGSDDGSALYIDGTQVLNDDGIHAYNNVSTTNEPLTAGQHSVEVIYFNHIYQGGQGGAIIQAYFGGLPASPAPEPSAIAIWAFVGLGAAGLVLKARKRKAAAV